MTHPAITLAQQLADYKNHNVLDVLARFSQDVWQLPIWIAGERVEYPDGKIKMAFQAIDGKSDENALLAVYFSEQEAVKHHATPNFSVPFFHLAVIINSQHIDILLVDADEEALLTHKAMLMIKDACTLDKGSISNDPEDNKLMINAAHQFCEEAYQYCATQVDVESLYMAFVLMETASPRVAIYLDGVNLTHHISAIEAMEKRLFKPNWSTLYLNHMTSTGAEITSNLKKLAPIYDHSQSQSWWAKFRRKLELPIITLIAK